MREKDKKCNRRLVTVEFFFLSEKNVEKKSTIRSRINVTPSRFITQARPCSQVRFKLKGSRFNSPRSKLPELENLIQEKKTQIIYPHQV